ncbi:MAG: hypothetical protein WC147_06420 [Syntrophomonas sp.]
MDNEQNNKESITLVSPLGLSPGLLYSALMTIKPQRIVVLTSSEGENSLDSIIKQAGYRGYVEVVRVDDPFNCFQQANKKAEEVLNILECTPCVVNLTGGTTALQFIIQRVGAALENRGCKVDYIALVDRRGVQAQKNDPWVVGELIRVI